jgi:hypothetical protein
VKESTAPIPMNNAQVQAIVKYVELNMDEAVRQDFFTQLGVECFACGHSAQWIDGFKGDITAFLDNVNIHHNSPFWESLALSSDGKRLTLIGKEVDKCVCPFAATENAPISLCNYCCRSFQETLFGYLFKAKVRVQITESFLGGGRRCSTLVEICNQ